MKRHSGSDRSLRDLSFDTLLALLVRMVYRQRLDLESILVQLKEQFVSAKGEYEAFEDQKMLAIACHSDGEVDSTAFSPISAVEQVDETVLARRIRRGQPRGFEPSP